MSTKLFQLYATGGYSLKQVNEILEKQGLNTREGFKVSKALRAQNFNPAILLRHNEKQRQALSGESSAVNQQNPV